MRKVEPLHRGLVTSTDPAVAPEGALQIAQNARYHPGDLAIWQAEGRKFLGDVGHGRVRALTGIQWDEGSTVDGIVPELEQILYISNGQLKTIPAAEVPPDPSMNAALARVVNPTIAAHGNLDSGVLTAVQFENEHFILTSGKVIKLTRQGVGQSALRAGMPAQEQDMDVLFQNGGNLAVTIAYYYFWFTWYDSVSDVEGTATIDASSRHRRVVDFTGSWLLQFNKLTFDDSKPPQADSIRLYTSGPWDVSLAGTEILSEAGTTNPWPVGYRVATIPVANLQDNVIGGAYNIVIKVSGSPFIPGEEIVVTQAEWNNLALVFPPMDIVTVTAGGIPVAVGKNGVPPEASTGDVFEESLVLNDINDRRKVRFSYPGSPEAFPAEFFINFETSDLDKVVAIRTLGNKLGVFLTTSVWRINWLPATSDFDFGRGRVRDEVVTGRGTFWHKGVTRFYMPGKGNLIAYIARTGIYATDLYSEIKLTRQLDWLTLVEGENLEQARIYDDPDEERLVFQLGSNLYYLHYDVDHLDENGIPSITGPIQRLGGVTDMDLVRTAGGRRRGVSGGEVNGLLYEGVGFNDEADITTRQWMVKTRDIYPAGVGEEAQLQDFFAHMKPALNASGEWTLRVNTFLSKTEFPILKISEQIPVYKRQLKLSTGRSLFEFYNIEILGPNAGASMAVNFVGTGFESLGQAEAR